MTTGAGGHRPGDPTAAARDGVEATHLMKVVRFDVIVSDLMMPNLDGLQLLARLDQLV